MSFAALRPSTQRLYLEPVTVNDHAFVQELVNTAGWLRFIGDRNVHSEEDAVAYIQKIQSMPNLVYWVARRKEDQQPAGIISFIKRDYLEDYDLGFAFLPRYHGQGYAKEAALGVMEALKTFPELQRLLATTLPENEPSVFLLQKLGFSFVKQFEEGGSLLNLYECRLQNAQASSSQ